MGKTQRLGQNILITGHKGFVGSYLVPFLKHRGYNVFGVDLKDGNDLRDIRKTRRLFEEFKPHYVVHLAAVTQVEDGLNQPALCFRNNIEATVTVCELARELDFKLIHMSTDKVYGEGLDKKEGDELNASYPYDASKVCCEKVVDSYRDTYGISSVVLRCCNIYGENDPNKRRIIPTILDALERGDYVKLRSNGKQLREYIYVGDFARALELLFDQEGVFNISSGEMIDALGILGLAQKVLSDKIKYVILASSNSELQEQSLNHDKLDQLGFKCEYSILKFLGEVLCKYR